MDQKDRNILQKNTVYLVKNLEVSDTFLDYMLQENIITDEHYEKFTKQAKTESKGTVTRDFLMLLRMRGPNAFRTFIEGTCEASQEFIAEKLCPEIAKAWKDRQQGPVSPKCSPPTVGTQFTYHHQQLAHPTDVEPPPGLPHGPPQCQPQSQEGLMNVIVKSVDQTDSRIRTLINSPEVYPMDKQTRGRAIIIQNISFMSADRNLKEREGSYIDEVHLIELFKRLNFTVDTWKDYSLQELRDKLKEERQRQEHKDANAFILVVLSHGTEGHIYTRFGEEISVENEIAASFDGHNCPYLVDKPKIFLVQACQGGDNTDGVPVSDSPDQVTRGIENMNIDETDTKPTGEEESQQVPVAMRIHEKSDILIAFATVPGYQSWRDEKAGTWFIRSFVETMCEKVHDDHLVDILTTVCRRVEEKSTAFYKHKQLTRTVSQLKKKLYFFPGYFQQSQ